MPPYGTLHMSEATEQRPLRQQVSRNLGVGWLAYAGRILILLLFIPYITSLLGTDGYGVWALVFQTAAYLALLDFGLQSAVARFVARFTSSDGPSRVSRVLGTATSLYLLIAAATILVTAVLAFGLFDLFRIEDANWRNDGRWALLLIGCRQAIVFLQTPVTAALAGWQRHDLLQGWSLVEEVTRVIAMVLLLSMGAGLTALAIAVVGAHVGYQAVVFIYWRRRRGQVSRHLTFRDRSEAHELWRFGRVSFAVTGLYLLLLNLDGVWLGLTISATATGLYIPAAQLWLHLRNAVNVAAGPIMTAAARLQSDQNGSGIAQLYTRGLRYGSFFAFSVASGTLLYAEPFVRLWLPETFSATASVMRILALGHAFFIPQIVGNAILVGTNRHAVLARLLVVELTLKIVLAVVLIPTYGLIGMAYAAAIPQMAIYGLAYPLAISRVLNLDLIATVWSGLIPGGVALATMALAGGVMRMVVPPTSWLSFTGNISVCLLAALATGWFLVDARDREIILSALRRRPQA